MIALNEIEARILGCLIEKEYTTPEHYPLTLNSLVAACNQKSNRNPVTSFDEETVEKGLEGLNQKGLANAVYTPGSRTVKYRHSFLEAFKLIPREAAILCELMLRGRQTAGELRGRADRVSKLNDIQEVEYTLKDLMERAEPLVVKLKREAGRKEPRHMHLLSGLPEQQPAKEEAEANTEIRTVRLEEDISALKSELEALKKAFEEFKSKFE